MATIIGLGAGTEAIPILERIKALGHRLLVVDGNPEAPGRQAADQFVCQSCYHGRLAINSLREAGVQPAGVLCAATDTPHAAAEIRRAFDLPGLRPEAAELSKSKSRQRDALKLAGLPVPQYVYIDEAAVYMGTRSEMIATFSGAGKRDDDLMLEDMNTGRKALRVAPDGLLVVKPDGSRGGRGVIRLLPAVVVDEAIGYARQFSGRIIIEQWLDGVQLSTESMVVDGRALFTAVGLRNYARLDEFAPFCIEDGADMPYGDGALVAECSALVERACRALGWDNLTVKGDLVIHEGRVKIIELAARLSGGFFASHYIPLAYGVDFVGAAARLAIGERIQTSNFKLQTSNYVSQKYVFPRPEDVARVVESVRKTNTLNDEWPPTAVFASWNVKAGNTIRPVTSHPDRLGQAIAAGRTAEEAQEKAEQAVEEMYAGIKIISTDLI